MKINGEVGLFLRSFYASPENYPWSISIRRVDDKEDPAFGKYHKELVPASYLQELIPDWDQLSWHELERPADVVSVFPRELMAESGAYRIYIIAKANSTEPVDEIIAQFKKVLVS